MATRVREKVRLGGKRQVTIPRRAAEQLRLRTGDVLEVRVQDGRIELVPMALIPRDQLWFWTPEWQAREREADEDIRAGRVESFHSADELIRSLRRARRRAAGKSARSSPAA